MSLGKKIFIGFMVLVTIFAGIFTYEVTLEAQKMWALGDIENLYNTPCDVKEVYTESNKALVTTIHGDDIKIDLGPFSEVSVGESISVVCDKYNNPITSFDRYYQIIQISLLGMFLTGMSFVLTSIALIISILEKREMKYYLDEDINDEDFIEYSYSDEYSKIVS